MRRGIMTIGVVFLVVMIVQQVLAGSGNVDSLRVQLEKLSKQKEFAEFRTENSRTFLNPDGKRVTLLSSEPLNYLEDDGKFYPIDTNLFTEKPGKKSGKFRHSALKNTLRARFADYSDQGMVMIRGKNRIEFTVKHKNKRQASVDRNVIRYSKVFDNCDLEYTVLPGRVKDDLVFSSIPASPIITYTVNLNGLKHRVNQDGSIELSEDSGEKVFKLLPSVMYEKNNPQNFKKIDTRFHWAKGQLFCDLILDMKWLKEKKRKYPVVVDPTAKETLTSSHQEQKIFRVYCPETYGTVKCTINIDGPRWFGYAGSYSASHFYFKDNDTTLFAYDWREAYHNDNIPPVSATAGHFYEIMVKAGKSEAFLGTDKSYATAVATITYGDSNGFLFSQVPDGNYGSRVNDVIVKKTVVITNTQDMSFNYIAEYTEDSNPGTIAPYFKVFKVLGDGSNVQIYSAGKAKQGTISLEKGMTYSFEICPKQRNGVWYHYRAELNFPYLTQGYEKKIILGTNPGYLESTFQVPKDNRLFLLQCRATVNGTPTSQGLPYIKLWPESATTPLLKRSFDLITCNNGIVSVDETVLQKETPYKLRISRVIRKISL
jgi:hypothetical protein